jgi:hypothetical protein
MQYGFTVLTLRDLIMRYSCWQDEKKKRFFNN